ncbi:hypothetical protein [Paenibacillus agricola]|uniref:TrbL/VirB6 plasmid conjugal transfer protein n=1 Tax=Paenibacillus agricola TaxID=2716264 RepID=A0ABX0JHT6_9BACL|nr:hypothetical protein [Paenibacillus agricola]NHN34894.1 hypothetical protein [Paenibacillus agricola]
MRRIIFLIVIVSFVLQSFFLFPTNSYAAATYTLYTPVVSPAINGKDEDGNFDNKVTRIWDPNDKEMSLKLNAALGQLISAVIEERDKCESWSIFSKDNVCWNSWAKVSQKAAALSNYGVIFHGEILTLSTRPFQKYTYDDFLAYPDSVTESMLGSGIKFDIPQFLKKPDSLLEYVTDPARVRTESELAKFQTVTKRIETVPTIPTNGGKFNPQYGVLGSKMEEYNNKIVNNIVEEPGLGESFLSEMMNNFANGIFNLFDMKDITLLIFGKDLAADDEAQSTTGCFQYNCRADQVYGVFEQGFFQAINVLYSLFDNYMPYPLVILLMLFGFHMAFFSGSQEGRSRTKDYAMSFLIGLISLKFGSHLWDVVFTINSYSTDIVWNGLIDNGVHIDTFLHMVWGNVGMIGFVANKTIIASILALLATFMTALMNYQYALRVFILGALLISFPIVCVLSIFPAFRHSQQIWWQELISYTFMDTAHALALGLFFLALQFQGAMSIWLFIAYFVGMPTIVSLFRQLIGIESHGSGFKGAAANGLGAMSGISSVMALSGMFRPNGGRNQGNDQSSLGNSEMGDTSNSPLIPNNKQGVFGSIANNGLLRGAVSASAGFAGAVASTAITGNPIIGHSIGASLGRVLTGGLGGLGKGMDGLMASASHDDGIGAGMESRYLSGEGGSLNNSLVQMGWGAERFINAVSGGSAFEDAPARKEAIEQHQEQYANSVNEMNQLKPQVDSAKAHFQELKSQYGEGSQWYKDNSTESSRPALPEQHKDFSNAEVNYKAAQAQLYAVKLGHDNSMDFKTAEANFNHAKDEFMEQQGLYGPGSQWFKDNTGEVPYTIPPEKPAELVKAEQQYQNVNARYEAAKSKAFESKGILTDRSQLKQYIADNYPSGNGGTSGGASSSPPSEGGASGEPPSEPQGNGPVDNNGGVGGGGSDESQGGFTPIQSVNGAPTNNSQNSNFDEDLWNDYIGQRNSQNNATELPAANNTVRDKVTELVKSLESDDNNEPSRTRGRL